MTFAIILVLNMTCEKARWRPNGSVASDSSWIPTATSASMSASVSASAGFHRFVAKKENSGLARSSNESFSAFLRKKSASCYFCRHRHRRRLRSSASASVFVVVITDVRWPTFLAEKCE